MSTTPPNEPNERPEPARAEPAAPSAPTARAAEQFPDGPPPGLGHGVSWKDRATAAMSGARGRFEEARSRASDDPQALADNGAIGSAAGAARGGSGGAQGDGGAGAPPRERPERPGQQRVRSGAGRLDSAGGGAGSGPRTGAGVAAGAAAVGAVGAAAVGAGAAGGAGGAARPPRPAGPGAGGPGQRPGGPRPAGPGGSTGRPVRPGEGDPRAARGRRVRLSVSRIDPWSVLKISFLLSVAAGIALVVATLALWLLLSGMGVFSSIDQTLSDLQAGSSEPFQIMDYIGLGRVLSLSIVIAVLDVVLITAISTMAAFLYNICSSLVGGVQLTLTDD